MTEIDQNGIIEAKAAYDRACGAVNGSDYTGFLLALTFAFWIGDFIPQSFLPKIVIQGVIAVAVIGVVRLYYSRIRRSAEDNYHRVAKLGKYAPPAVGL